MNWATIIIFFMIVVVGESKKVYEAKIVQYSCPTHCLASHEHIQLNIKIYEDSLYVAEREN